MERTRDFAELMPRGALSKVRRVHLFDLTYLNFKILSLGKGEIIKYLSKLPLN